MHHWQLLLLIALTVAGAMITARYEASQYALLRKLSHLLLSLTRLACGLLLIRLVADPESFWTYALCMLMMMGVFGPSHRISLWWFRTHRFKQRTPFWHLGTGPYDSLWMTLTHDNQKTAFLVMNGFEALVAAAMYIQLQN